MPAIAERDTGQLASPKPGLDIAIALDREEVANWERRIATEVSEVPELCGTHLELLLN